MQIRQSLLVLVAMLTAPTSAFAADAKIYPGTACAVTKPEFASSLERS